MKYYNKLSSKVYNFDKYIGKSFGDIEFLINNLNQEDKILEPATGNGRVMIPLLRKGFNVHGFDSSKHMLNYCFNNLEKENLETHLFLGDMVNFKTKNLYDVIIITAGSFLLLTDISDSIKALNNFYNHLSNGGRLIIDIYIPSFDLNSKTSRTFNIDDNTSINLETITTNIDYSKKVITYNNIYTEYTNGVISNKELELFPLKWFEIKEFLTLLQNAKFHNIEIYKDYDRKLNNLEEKADTYTFIAYK